MIKQKPGIAFWTSVVGERHRKRSQKGEDGAVTKEELMENYSVDMIQHFPPVHDLFTKYFPQFQEEEFVRGLPQGISFHFLITERGMDEGLCEKLLAEKKEFDRAYRKLMEKEVLEFGVPVDLDDPLHQWSNQDAAVQEACVKKIEERYAGRKHEIIFYGPSNIQMWYSLEEDMLPYVAQNHGMGGCIDQEMIKYAPRMLYAFEPSVVFFQTGSNDLALGIPIDQILENKKKMYGIFLENMPETKLVVMSGLPLPGRMKFWDLTVETNKLLQKMCEETERMYFMDATDSLLGKEGPEEFRASDGRYFMPQYFRADQIHLNKAGHDVWTALMKEMLESF